MSDTDALEALYAQMLAGGSPRVINPVDVRGPNISPMQFADMSKGGGGASGFANLADGILGYLDRRKAEKEKAAGTGVSDAPPPDNTFGGGGSQYQGTPQPAPPTASAFGGGGAQYQPPPTSAGVPTPEVTTSPLPEQEQAPQLPLHITPEQAAMLTPAQLAWIFAHAPR